METDPNSKQERQLIAKLIFGVLGLMVAAPFILDLFDGFSADSRTSAILPAITFGLVFVTMVVINKRVKRYRELDKLIRRRLDRESDHTGHPKTASDPSMNPPKPTAADNYDNQATKPGDSI